MIQTYQKIYKLLLPAERRQFLLLILLMALVALIEVAGVASISPFLAVLGNPELVQSNEYLNRAYVLAGFSSPNQFLIALAVGAIAILVLASALKALNMYAQYRFTYSRQFSLNSQLLGRYLRQPYRFFLDKNSSDFTKNILSEVEQVVINAIVPSMHMISFGLPALFILILLFIVDWKIATSMFVFLGGFYATFYLLIRNWLLRIGKQRLQANQDRYKSVAEALGGIKELKLLGSYDFYLSSFKKSSKQFSYLQAINHILAAVPKLGVEAIGFVVIFSAAIYLIMTKDNIGTVLATLGLYAFAGYRLIPALQNIYAAAAKLRAGAASLDEISYSFQQTKDLGSEEQSTFEKVNFKNKIEFQNVGFSYNENGSFALKRIQLKMDCGSATGVVGETGSGKSTLVDLLLGLLAPTNGKLLIDGTELTKNHLRDWQKKIGYVPQSIYLSDETIASNIAFGEQINQQKEEQIVKALITAQLYDFIKELPKGIYTRVGERGVMLSGGQRQRIGIARALYRDPEILVFDEATSALDLETEKKLIEAIHSLSKRKTIVMIAHRLESLKFCDYIISLKDGEIIECGVEQSLLDREVAEQ